MISLDRKIAALFDNEHVADSIELLISTAREGEELAAEAARDDSYNIIDPAAEQTRKAMETLLQSLNRIPTN